jgi:hypothetical protein
MIQVARVNKTWLLWFRIILKSRVTNNFTRDLRLLVDFFNFDFKGKYRRPSKKDIPSMWLRWLIGARFDSPRGWKKADRVQRQIVERVFDRKTGERDINQLVADANRHVEKVMWDVGRDGRTIEMVPVISGEPEAYLYSCILSALMNGQFWLLKRCRECQQFFAGKEKFCGAACRRSYNNSTAKERVRKARATKRFREILPKLVRLQKMAKTKSLSEMLDEVAGLDRLDPKLLADIIEGSRPLKDLEVKYKNRRILLGLKI